MKSIREHRIANELVRTRERYRVADLRIDVGAMRVRQGGRELRLPPLSFELLLLLTRRAPDVVTRDECLDIIWRDVVVGPETLKQRVKLLRESLSDDSRLPRYIETVRGRGYRLVPAVMIEEDHPEDWASRLRSRLKELLGPGHGGGESGGGGLALGGLLLLASYFGAALEVAEKVVAQDNAGSGPAAEVRDAGQAAVGRGRLPSIELPDRRSAG
jgi:DNA-binding winged helix-turn-helix (wHTH) protein